MAKRVAVSAAGGCLASSTSGGACNKGARKAALMRALSIGMEKVSGYKPTLKTSDKGGVVKFVGDGVENSNASNVGKSIEVIKGRGADHLVGRELSSLTAEEAKLLLDNNPLNEGKISIEFGNVNFSWDTEGSRAFSFAAKNIPGMNSMAVFHDVWMAKQNATSAFYLGVTIAPALYVNYEALGFSYYGHLYGKKN